ncbi:MAG: hypothetical protein JSW39_08575 [Desulfobacterales bacterium]|nr:MAG: hypothetical protein JSW39_08575 [Desulfobacterales bacterium]
MKNKIEPADPDLKRMKARIEQIEQLVLDLKTSGAGVPVVEQNARVILSFVNILKLGIGDPAELMDE